MHRIKTGWYELPGGKIGKNEKSAETAVREAKEELCCDVEIIKQVGKQDFEENGYVMIYIWYLATIIKGNPVVGEPEKYNRVVYLPIKKLQEYTLSPNMKNLVAAISDGTVVI